MGYSGLVEGVRCCGFFVLAQFNVDNDVTERKKLAGIVAQNQEVA
jgi:hypothetical protein